MGIAPPQQPLRAQHPHIADGTRPQLSHSRREVTLCYDLSRHISKGYRGVVEAHGRTQQERFRLWTRDIGYRDSGVLAIESVQAAGRSQGQESVVAVHKVEHNVGKKGRAGGRDSNLRESLSRP